ncbi:hypothetical protein [Aeromicrobium sp. Root472D3]|uniref:hypothetical protein n=1 Tax=Aeromicrobium sp. Root472D3 TaxID=1736540 RepID=UPI0006FB811D|nr:hypothetical protein [Aeromicrobium sp. Root472D3]KQX74301.1 hypothetical protein ASD10_03375 [Aeromicrobium sp. Root472D3]
MASRRLRIAATFTSTVAMVGAGLAVASVPAQAAPSFAPCAPAYPLTKVDNGSTVSNLTPGQSVTGLTSVDSGAPVQFTGTYVGTIDNGIADGLDMLVFDLKGPRLTNADGSVAAGNWAGISGSPIYDDATGDLVGSVSYGFTSALSPRAGVTPATYLYDLSAPGYSASATARSTVKASPREAAAIQRASDRPGALGVGRVLEPTKQVSGVNATVANKIAKKSRLLQKSPALAGGFRAGGGGGGSDVDYPIVPGGSIAVTAGTGTVTTGLVGTVTAVCGDQVYAFGHPGNFTGASTATFNGAQTVMIQEDGVMSPSFKIANIGRVKGVVTQDRLQGVVGTLGQAPTQVAQVTTTSTAPRLAAPKTSRTTVSDPAALPYTVASQVASDAITTLNQNAAGDALMSWTIRYTRARSAGVKTFKRTQRYATTSSLAETVSYDVASDVESLIDNGFEKVTVSAVDVSSAFQPTSKAVKPARAQQYTRGKWRWVGRHGVKAKRGSTIVLRARLSAADSDSTARPSFTRGVKYRVSKSARGTGKIVLTGHQTFSFDDLEELFFADEDMLKELLADEAEPPKNLTQLIEALGSVPRQDDLVGTFSYKNGGGKLESERTVRATSVVDGSLKVRVTFRR